MHGPDAGVSCVVSEDKMTGRWEDVNISSGRVRIRGYRPIPDTITLRNEIHVMSVIVDRVINWDGVVDGKLHDLSSIVSGIGSEDIVVAGEVERFVRLPNCFRHEKGRYVVVATIRDIVDSPEPVTGSIGSESDFDIVNFRRFLWRFREKGNKEGGIDILARRKIVLPWFGLGRRTLVCIWIVDYSKCGWVEGTTTLLNGGSHPVLLAGFSNSFDDDVHALSNAKGDNILRGLDNGDKIHSDDIQSMTIDTEMLESVSSRVDEAKTMKSIRLEVELGDTGVAVAGIVGCIDGGAVEIVLAVDE